MELNKSKKPVVRHNGHESVLHTFCKNNTKITLALCNGNFFEGAVRAYDKYTISLVDEDGRIRVFFKSALSYFAGGQLPENTQYEEDGDEGY